MQSLVFAAIGAVAGLVMGVLGIGGGAIIISGLALFAGLSQKTAQGTTLMIVAAPISLIAALNYYKAGHVDLKAVVIVTAAFAVFSFMGSRWGGAASQQRAEAFGGVRPCFDGMQVDAQLFPRRRRRDCRLKTSYRRR